MRRDSAQRRCRSVTVGGRVAWRAAHVGAMRLAVCGTGVNTFGALGLCRRFALAALELACLAVAALGVLPEASALTTSRVLDRRRRRRIGDAGTGSRGPLLVLPCRRPQA